MPEGHSVHRIARQFALHFVGKRIWATSPQGRFAAGAAEIDGHLMTEAKAVGKQMFLGFDNDLWLRVHLGMYGAWDFAGEITADAIPTARTADGKTPSSVLPTARPDDESAPSSGTGVVGSSGVGPNSSVFRMGQTNQRGTVVGQYEDSLGSIGAPRRTRLRMSEQEKLGEALESFPPPPIGQVRVRLLTDVSVADLRGPTACEVIHPEQVAAVIAGLGPDPLVHKGKSAEDAFVTTVLKKSTPIGLLLMDQSVVSGIGNVYRAELLFRARLNPHTPGRLVPEETVRAIWRDWVKLLKVGVATGHMLTMDRLGKKAYAAALASREDRHWVYKREGLPCRVCGTHIAMELAASRKLYWCPNCQA